MYYPAAALIPKALETEYKRRRKTQVIISHHSGTHTSMTAISKTNSIITSIMIHHPDFVSVRKYQELVRVDIGETPNEPSVWRMNFFIRRIASESLLSVRSTPASRSSNILNVKGEIPPICRTVATRTYSLCTPISSPMRPACWASIVRVPEIVSIVLSCSCMIICCSSLAHCLWWSSSSGRISEYGSRCGDRVPASGVVGKGVCGRDCAGVESSSVLISYWDTFFNMFNLRKDEWMNRAPECRAWLSLRTAVVRPLLYLPDQTYVDQLSPRS